MRNERTANIVYGIVAAASLVIIAVFVFIIAGACEAHGQINGRRLVRVTLASSPETQARDYKLAPLHKEFKYQVGLLWEQRLEPVGTDTTTVLKLSDPLKPLLQDIVELRLCGDVTPRFKSIEHHFFVLVYSRTSPKKNYDCRNVIAIYPIRSPEEMPALD